MANLLRGCQRLKAMVANVRRRDVDGGKHHDASLPNRHATAHRGRLRLASELLRSDCGLARAGPCERLHAAPPGFVSIHVGIRVTQELLNVVGRTP